MMRFYNQRHRFYGGVDLHARSLPRIFDASGATVVHGPLAAATDAFLDAVAPTAPRACLAP